MIYKMKITVMDRRTDILIRLDLTLFTYLSKHKLLNQFINNALNHPSCYQRRGTINTFSTFWWKYTPQGYDFWKKVRDDYAYNSHNM